MKPYYKQKNTHRWKNPYYREKINTHHGFAYKWSKAKPHISPHTIEITTHSICKKCGLVRKITHHLPNTHTTVYNFPYNTRKRYRNKTGRCKPRLSLT